MSILFSVPEGWTGEIGPIILKVDGVRLNLTGYTVGLIIRPPGGTEQVIPSGQIRVDSDQVTNPGAVYYTPTAVDLVVASNFWLTYYTIRWKVTDANSKVVFFANGAADTFGVYLR